MALTNYEEEYLKEWNSYFYPGTETLKNKLNIQDPEELKDKEAEITFEKIVELFDDPIKGNFDSQHLCDIHRYIFSEIYDWAGEYRRINMRKRETYYPDVQNIDTYLKDELRLLNEDIQKVHSKRELAYVLATYYIELLNIHPFREGNGRTVREFFRQFTLEMTPSLDCGPMELDFTKMNKEAMALDLFVVRTFKGPVEEQFYNALTPVVPEENPKITM